MIPRLRSPTTSHVRWIMCFPGVFLVSFALFQNAACSVDKILSPAAFHIPVTQRGLASPRPVSSPSDDSSAIRHEITSEFQEDSLPLYVLVPDSAALTRSDSSEQVSQRFPVVYVLPVEANGEHRWGDAIQECLKQDLHNRYQMILVFPEFSALPWYADHPSDAHLRQESYLLKTVIPFVDSHYPTKTARQGRLLTGFSKSGWGAFSLLLRNPETFSAAAIFDAPLMMSHPGLYGSGPIFGDDRNFQRYRLSKLIEGIAAKPDGSGFAATPPRFAIIGGGNFQREHDEFTSLLMAHSIPAVILSNEPREHSWHSGWLQPAVHWLHSVSK